MSPRFSRLGFLLLLLSSTGFAQTPPGSPQGKSFTVTEAPEGGNMEDRLIFTNDSQGQKFDPVDNEIDGFTYTFTADPNTSSAKVVLQLKTDKWDEFIFTFSPTGGGTFTLKEYDDSLLKDTDSGSFTDSRANGDGGLPASLSGITIETFETVETDTPERLDFLTRNRGREVEPGDVDPFSYTYQVTGAATASAVLVFRANWKWDEFDFVFTSDTAGTYVQRRFDKRVLKDTKNGSFVVTDNTAVLDPIAAGWYDGVLEVEDLSKPDDDDYAGRVQVSLTGTGGFSAKLHLPTREIRVSGAFDSNGKYQNTLSLRTGESVQVTLVLEALASGYKVTGSVLFQGVTYVVDGDQRTFHERRNPCSKSGRYTLILTGDGAQGPSLTAGDGYAVIRITKDGLAEISGRLADGLPWTAGVRLRQNSDLTFLVNLYGNRGSLGGRLIFSPVAGVSDCGGVLHWKRNAGVVFPRSMPHYYPTEIDVDRTAVGSRYVAPARGRFMLALPSGSPNFEVVLEGGGLSQAQIIPGKLNFRHEATFPAKSGIRLEFVRSNGLFGGYFTDASGPRAVRRPFFGAVLQTQAKGFGFFFGSSATGSVEIQAPAPVGPSVP